MGESKHLQFIIAELESLSDLRMATANVAPYRSLADQPGPRRRLRPENKVLPYLALVAAKNGAKLKPNAGEPWISARSVDPLQISRMSPGLGLRRGLARGFKRTACRRKLDCLANIIFGSNGPPRQCAESLSPRSKIGPSVFTALQQQLRLRRE
jgi:hypothetical protein